MTTLAILGGDFEVLLADETTGTAGTNAGLRMIRRAAGATNTVYTTNALYSAVAEVTDDFIAMGFKNPMLPVTPNAYDVVNYYFIPRSATEYLKEGAITADWTLAAPNGDGDGNGCIRVEYSVGLGTNFVAGDVGRQIVAANGDQGTLLDFEIEPDGTTVAWIRPNDSTPVTGDLFDGTGSLEVTTDGGTGTVTQDAAGTSGITQFSAIQAIGSVPTATEVYVVQDRNKLADATTNTFQWWDTFTDVSLGIISVLVRVRNSGTLIADGDVEVFARRYTSLYDNFRLNVAGGGFSALPLASAPDINNTTGYLSATLSGSTGTWDVGSGIYVGASWAAATAKGVITSGGTGATPTLEYYLVGDLTTINDTNGVTEYDFSTAADGDASGTINGVPGATSGGPTDTASGEGGTVTITLGETLQDYDNDAVNEPYSMTLNAQGNVPVAKVYERLKYLTRRGEQTDPFAGGPFNIPGETYRGLDATLEYDAATGTLTDGEDVFITLPTPKANFSARLIARCNTATPTHITLTDIQTSLTSAQPADNDVIEDSGSVDDVTLHAGGTFGLEFYSSPKSSPFGTFTGTQLFAARGVYVSNPAGADTQNYILTDNLGNLRSPPNTVAFTVENTRAGDRILVARDTTTLGVIDKDQFGGIATGTLAASTITVTGSIDSEVPPSGYVRVVSTAAGTGLLQEHHYVYDSRTTGASGVFTLRPDAAGTGITTGDTPDANGVATLTDTTATFQTDNVEIGMLVRNTTALKTTHVWEVVSITSETALEVVQLYGPLDATQDWDVSDTYTINTLIGDHTVPGNYSTSDNLYDLILDVEETVGTDGSPGSESNTFVQSTTFNVVVNVRQGKVILPFTQNAAVGASGGSVTVVRSEDTIAV